jgi:vitamin B12 transporter
MKKERKVWAITSIVLWLLAPNQIIAQDSLVVRQLQEVVVTATKFPKNQSETGKVLTIIDEDILRRSAGKDVAQLLNEQVGMAVSGSNSNTGKDKSVYLRGAKNEYTLILLDGVPLNDPSGISGGAYDLRLISLDQVERIEILKGSQSTLYGSDAIAGVINIITKKSEENTTEFFGTVGYGSYNTMKGSAGIRGSGKHIGYNVSYSGLATDGISEASENGTMPFDKDRASQHAFQTTVDIKPFASLSIRPFFRYSKFNGQYDGGAFTDDVLNIYEATLLNAGAQASYSLKEGAIHFQYAYDQTDRFFDGTYGKSEYFGKFHHAELFANYNLGDHLQLLTGIVNQEYKMLDKTATETDPSVIMISPYLSLLGRFGNFSAEIGGRYNHHTKFGENFTYSFNPSYRMKNGVKLFFNLSTGFKAPSLYQLYGQYGANPQLKPEKSFSSEIGSQWLSQDKKIELRLVAFTRSIQDVIVYTYPTNINLDKQNDQGIELESSFSVSAKFNVKAFYSFVDGKVKTQVLGKDTTFHNLFRRPKHMVGINLGYQISPQTYVSLNSKFFGQRSDLYFDMETFTNQSVSLQAYTLLDFYAEYQFKKTKATFFVDLKNILNTDYQEVYGYSTMGLNIHTGINVRF